MKIGETLKWLLDKHGLNTLELARRTGIGQPVIYRIMSGETDNPKCTTVCTLADYFGITVNQLIGESPLPELDANTKTPKLSEVPLLDWNNIDNKSNAIQKHEKVFVDLAPNPNLLALKIDDESMEPLFPKGTLLIIDRQKKTMDRNYVLVKQNKAKKILFRQLLIDDNFYYLKPLNPNTERYKMKLFNKKTDAFEGVLVQAKMDYNL